MEQSFKWQKLLYLSCILFLLHVLAGCSFVLPITEVRPLEERVIGGKGKDKVLLVDISGMISGKKRLRAFGFKEKPSLISRVKEELEKAEEDGTIKAIVLRINSHGGTVTASDIIHHEIKEYKKRTKAIVVTQMLDVATSGGYYIATATDRIVAHPTTVTGSIGVVAFKLNAQGLMEKIGLADETVKSGDKKDIGSPLRAMTPEEREILKGIINNMYERFLEVVVEGRKEIDRERLKDIADGRIYSAKQALDLKLIDKIGYLDDAIELAKEEAGIKDAKIITYARPSDYRSNIYSSSDFQLPSTINLINIDADTFMERFNTRFMYMWMP